MARKLPSQPSPASGAVATSAQLGALVRQQRHHLQLRIDDAAALCGVSTGMLSRLENGSEGVALGKVLAILQALGMAMQVQAHGRAGLLEMADSLTATDQITGHVTRRET